MREKFAPIGGVWPSFKDDDFYIDAVHLDNGRDMPVTDARGGERVFHYEADFIVWWSKKQT